jgi:hypothetical protein
MRAEFIRRPPRSVPVRVLAEKVELEQAFLLLLPVYHVTIVPPMLHTHYFISLQRYTNLAIETVVK